MRKLQFIGLSSFLLVAAAVAVATDAPLLRPVFHEEASSVWDEVTQQFHDLGSRFREHFGGFREARGERPLISYMLSRRDELNLSSDQVRNLERLRSDFERDAVKNEADLRVAEMDLSELLRSDPVDLKKAEAKIREIEKLRAELRLARVRAIEQGKQVLSQEQRVKLRDMLTGSRYSRRPEGSHQ
jgi:Spy/CpxP family protein refolding chaperone